MKITVGTKMQNPLTTKGRFTPADTRLAAMRRVAIPGLAAMFMRYSVSLRICR